LVDFGDFGISWRYGAKSVKIMAPDIELSAEAIAQGTSRAAISAQTVSRLAHAIPRP
jgi:hypothetical protein